MGRPRTKWFKNSTDTKPWMKKADGGDIPLPKPDPRTPQFLGQAVRDYATKIGRPPEKFTPSDVQNLQSITGNMGGRDRD